MKNLVKGWWHEKIGSNYAHSKVESRRSRDEIWYFR